MVKSNSINMKIFRKDPGMILDLFLDIPYTAVYYNV